MVDETDAPEPWLFDTDEDGEVEVGIEGLSFEPVEGWVEAALAADYHNRDLLETFLTAAGVEFSDSDTMSDLETKALGVEVWVCPDRDEEET